MHTNSTYCPQNPLLSPSFFTPSPKASRHCSQPFLALAQSIQPCMPEPPLLSPPTRTPRSGACCHVQVCSPQNLISLQLPGLPNPVSALIDSGATSNFLDSSLATSPTFVLEPLDLPITLCLFYGKPATAGFIHESVNICLVC